MNSSLLQISNVTIAAADFVALQWSGGQGSSCLKCWWEFDNDLVLRSDPGDASTEYVLRVSKGNEFILPVTGPVVLNRPLVYAKASGPDVHLTLFFVMQ